MAKTILDDWSILSQDQTEIGKQILLKAFLIRCHVRVKSISMGTVSTFHVVLSEGFYFIFYF